MTSTFRALSDSGDWSFGKGLNDYAQENQAIGLNIKTRILSWFSDCFFDLNAGIDWFNRVGSKNQREVLEADLRRIVSQTQDVTAINSLDIIFNDRNFTATFDVETIYSRSYITTVENTF